MGGVILAHITKIGIEHNNDNGLLFGAAIFTFILGILLLYSERKNLPMIRK